MSEHECIIGLLHDYDDAKLVTVSKLLEEIKYERQHYSYMCNLCKKYNIDKPTKYYTIKDYCNKRKSTNLERFEFCPYCGKKIDWKKIKNEEVE